jgi:hypothetical protein
LLPKLNAEEKLGKFMIKIPKTVVINALKTALVVGTILTLINQYSALFGSDTIKLVPLILTYCVPFCVFLYSWWVSQKSK